MNEVNEYVGAAHTREKRLKQKIIIYILLSVISVCL